MRRLLPFLLVLTLAVALPAALARPSGAHADATCGLSSPAFCDTFDAPVGGAERSGDLDATVWGVSRSTQNENIGQGERAAWPDATMAGCGATQTVTPVSDVRVCGGRLVEAQNDGGSSAVLAMYPRQPFDFAGRTGIVAFDVSDDTLGSHTSWPALVIADQPVPAPDGETVSQPGIDDYARNSVGMSFGQLCGPGAGCGTLPPGSGDGSRCVSVDQMWTTADYADASLPFAARSCVLQPAAGSGTLNHFEAHISSSQIQIYGTDAGTSAPLRLIAEADNAQLPLTRGLVWIEDAHYNGNKFDPGASDHQYVWDNVGFDGPVLARDLGEELPDATTRYPAGTGYGAGTDIGFAVPKVGNGAPFSAPFAGAANVAGASAALLEFTCWPQQSGDSFSYSLNGHAARTVAPTMLTFSQQTVALPVTLADLQDGDNILSISDTQEDIDAANFDLILVGAGQQPPTPTPIPTTTATTTTSVTSSQTATASTWTLICTETTGDPRTVACRGQ